VNFIGATERIQVPIALHSTLVVIVTFVVLSLRCIRSRRPAPFVHSNPKPLKNTALWRPSRCVVDSKSSTTLSLGTVTCSWFGNFTRSLLEVAFSGIALSRIRVLLPSWSGNVPAGCDAL
jgi:hypothetical protein